MTDTPTPDPLTIAEARKLDRDHPGVWFCACGAGWLGTAEGYPDDLHSHARFRAEYEPGAAHDPGLATFRPDTLAARPAPDSGLDVQRLAKALAVAFPTLDATGFPRDDAVRIAAAYREAKP